MVLGINKSVRLKRFSKKQLLVFLAFILCFASVGTYFLIRSLAFSAGGLYNTWWWSDPPDGFYNFDYHIVPEKVTANAPFYWSHQFSFKNGRGGYFGMQSAGHRQDGSVGKLAIFSIWGASRASGPSCQAAYGEGATKSCSIPYEWVEGHDYRLRIWAISRDANGDWWGVWVKDTTTNVETFVGQIQVPLGWRGLSGQSLSWTEFFGSTNSCDRLPYSRVRFYGFRANNESVRPSASDTTINRRNCSNISITPVNDGYVQTMGNINYIWPTMRSGSRLNAGQSITTTDGRYTLKLQDWDGHLVMYNNKTGKPIWYTGKYSYPGYQNAHLDMQADGNLVLYSGTGKAIWFSNTYGSGVVSFQVQNDGNLVLYNTKNIPKWSSGTSGK